MFPDTITFGKCRVLILYDTRVVCFQFREEILTERSQLLELIEGKYSVLLSRSGYSIQSLINYGQLFNYGIFQVAIPHSCIFLMSFIFINICLCKSTSTSLRVIF